MTEPIEADRRPVSCPRCGTEAEWTFTDDDKTNVQVNCPECGQVAMGREQFDQAENGSNVEAVVEKPESVERED